MDNELNWEQYEPYFDRHEFACKHTGLCNMTPEFMEKLLELRKIYRRPMIITSGYRAPTHPLEIKKAVPGEHAMGRAADIACEGSYAYELVRHALALGFVRVGISQRAGVGRYIHLGIGGAGLPAPRIWSY